MNILFVFNLGSELRQFSHSGLIKRLEERGHSIFVTSRHLSDEFSNELEKGVTIVPYFPSTTSFWFAVINKAVNKSYKTKFSYDRDRSDNLKKLLTNSLISLISRICRPGFIRNSFIKAEHRLLFRRVYSDWRELLVKYRIDRIITNAPNLNLALLKEAYSLDIERILLYHTNKDILAVERMVIPYSRYGVWNKKMKSEVQRKYCIVEEKIEVLGCLHFSYLSCSGSKKRGEPGSQFPVFTYICAANNIKGEESIIKLLTDKLNQVFNGEYLLVLRDNPMSTEERWLMLLSSNVRIQKPAWYYSRKENFNFARKEDLVIFRDLLERSVAVFGLPSTVVIEASICNKPFINIMVENEMTGVTTIRGNLSDLWNLDIYSNVRRYEAAVPVYTGEELVNVLTRLKENRDSYRNMLRETYLSEEIGSLEFETLLERHCRLIEK